MKLLVAIALVLALTVPAIACGGGSDWEDVISRALVKTGEAWSYRSTGNSTAEVEGRTLQSSTESEHVLDDFHVKYATNCGAEAPSSDSASVKSFPGCELEEFLTTISNDGEHGFWVNAGRNTTTGNVSVTVVASGGCRPGWAEWTVIDDKAYIRSSDSPEWRECQVRTQGQPVPLPSEASPAPSPTLYGNSTYTVVMSASLARELEYLDWLTDVEKLPAEYVDGVDCSHFRGRVDMDGYTDMVVERNRLERAGQPTPEPEILDLQRRQERLVELWIDDDGYIRRLTVNVRFPIPDPDTGEEVWVTGLSTIRYFDFNQPITIEPPH